LAEPQNFSSKVEFSLLNSKNLTHRFLHQNRNRAFFCHFEFSRLNPHKFDLSRNAGWKNVEKKCVLGENPYKLWHFESGGG